MNEKELAERLHSLLCPDYMHGSGQTCEWLAEELRRNKWSGKAHQKWLGHALEVLCWIHGNDWAPEGYDPATGEETPPAKEAKACCKAGSTVSFDDVNKKEKP